MLSFEKLGNQLALELSRRFDGKSLAELFSMFDVVEPNCVIGGLDLSKLRPLCAQGTSRLFARFLQDPNALASSHIYGDNNGCLCFDGPLTEHHVAAWLLVPKRAVVTP